MPSDLDELISSLGFNAWGTARLERPHSFDHYRDWVESGLHGEMEYLKLHLPQKENPEQLLPRANSALVLAINYRPHPHPTGLNFKALRVASYAQGMDYHYWLKQKLQAVVARLQEQWPKATFLAMTDSHPVLERDLAHRAGIGWFGKNTCLLSKEEGSFFLIGEIFTDLEWTANNQVPPDLCGSCTRCIDQCPTKAITAPQKLDARLCISYWTIESRKAPPPELRHEVGEWFFGCDICQQVCPWNEKAFGRELLQRERSEPPNRAILLEELEFILNQSNNQLLKTFSGTPLTRPGGRGLKRNAILTAARHRLTELAPLIDKTAQEHPDLREVADWALQQLTIS